MKKIGLFANIFTNQYTLNAIRSKLYGFQRSWYKYSSTKGHNHFFNTPIKKNSSKNAMCILELEFRRNQFFLSQTFLKLCYGNVFDGN